MKKCNQCKKIHCFKIYNDNINLFTPFAFEVGIQLDSIGHLWTENKFWVWVGSGIYGISWIFFGLGFIISGKEGLTIIKNKLSKK